MAMKDEDFQELLESVKEMQAIERGELKPARITVIAEPDVKAIRAAYGLSQRVFAEVFGVNLRTLQNWEQGRRKPRGPARLLLSILEHNPRALLDVVNEIPPEEWEPEEAVA